MGEVALFSQVINTRHLSREEENEKESIFDDYLSLYDMPLLLAL